MYVEEYFACKWERQLCAEDYRKYVSGWLVQGVSKANYGSEKVHKDGWSRMGFLGCTNMCLL